MTKATARAGQCPPGTKMTIRVYTVDREGSVTEDRGTVSILDGQEPPPAMPVNPPCSCSRCTAARETAR